MKLQLTFCAALMAASLASVARATDVSAVMTADNSFSLYVSTDDAVTGTFVGSGNSWPTEFNFTQALTPGVTNYLHIIAVDSGPPAMLIGQFTLSDTNFQFGNGTQSLLTNTSLWSVSTTGFGSNYAVPLDLGADGTSPWGNFTNINDSAHFIWANEDVTDKSEFFSATITSNTVAPEPASMAMLLVGACGLLARKRRRA